MNTSAPETHARLAKSGQAWPAGWTKLHVYLTELGEVKPLADSYRPVVAEIPGERPVPLQWLHATIASVECDAATIGPATRHELIERLRQHVGRLAGFDLTIGPALAATGAVMLDTSPDADFQQLVRTCVTVIDEVVDGNVGKPCGGPGHVSLSYRPDSIQNHPERGEISNRLRDIRPGRAEIKLTGVDLVEVFQGEGAGTYTWETIARIPLAPLPIGEFGTVTQSEPVDFCDAFLTLFRH